METSNFRSGLLAAGNFIVDQFKTIDHWPEQDALASILDHSFGNGGGPYNILKDLAIAGSQYPLAAAGLTGMDQLGKFIKQDLEDFKIDTRRLQSTELAPTSYTDVMTAKDTGRRTFFHMKGANALLDLEHFDFSDSNYRVFYLGYLMLLDKLDEFDPDNVTYFTRVLQTAKSAGMVTVADAVSAQHPNFQSIVESAVRHIDVLVLNEWEAGKATNRQLFSNDQPDWREIRNAADTLLAKGNLRSVFIHFPQGAFAKTCDGDEAIQGKVKLPQSEISGSVGAGDAFCAGVIHGIHEGYPIGQTLKIATAMAAACLRSSTTSEGLMSFDQCQELADRFGFDNIA